jgi:hypothetical protein
MDRDTLLIIAGAGGFALGVMFAIGLGISLYLKHWR